MSFINPKKIISQAVVASGSVVADFGFGKGDFLKYLSKEVGEDGRVYAFDIQKDIVGRVSQEFQEGGIKNTNFLNIDLEKEKSTGLAEASVDFILISSLFFQTKRKEEISKEAVRILKSRGRILFIDWRDYFNGVGPDKELVFSENDALVFWKKYPLELERRVESGDYHYGLIYRKQ